MTDFEKLHIEWIDYSNDEDKVNFLNALNSYLFFKKDSIDQCELLIKKNPKFNAPKLLKIVLILLSNVALKGNYAGADSKLLDTEINTAAPEVLLEEAVEVPVETLEVPAKSEDTQE